MGFGFFGGRFWALIGATFLGFLGIGTVLPALAPHVRFDLGGSDRTVGFVIGVFSFVALAGRLIAGPLADRRGRKLAFLAGLLSCAFAGGAYLLPLGIGGAYLGRVLQGFGEACLYTGAAAWAVELAGIERGGQALAYVSSGIWGGLSAGPVVGHWMGTFQRAAGLQSTLALVAFGIVALVREDYNPEHHEPRTEWLPRYLIGPGITIGFLNVYYPVITGFLILHLAGHGNSGPTAFTTWAVLILLSRFFLGGLPDRTKPAITFYGGLALMCIGLSVIAAGPSPRTAILAAGLLGFGASFPWTSVAMTALRQAPTGQRASAVGVISAFYDLFVGMSSFAAGAVSNRWGYPAAFAMGTAALVAAAVAGRWVFFEKRGVSFPSRDRKGAVASTA